MLCLYSSLALVAFILACRLAIKRIVQGEPAPLRYYTLSEKYPAVGEPVWVLFKDLRGRPAKRPMKCRLGDHYEYPEWILPDGSVRALVFTVGWRPCTDQIPNAINCTIINPYDNPRRRE